MSQKTIELRLLFRDLQAELEGRLGTARRNLSHPGAKGSVTEGEWTSLLCAYLPKRYAVSKGFVVDVAGRISDEIDIIIHDRHFSPLLFHHAQTCYVPAESVYAVLEVKPELSLENIRYAGQKASSVRVLHRTSTQIAHAGGIYAPRNVHRILAGILTSTSSWRDPTASINSALQSLDAESRLDFGCAARDVAFRATYENGLSSEISRSGDELVFLLLNLLRSLQVIGSAPAIDYGAYLASLNEGME